MSKPPDFEDLATEFFLDELMQDASDDDWDSGPALADILRRVYEQGVEDALASHARRYECATISPSRSSRVARRSSVRESQRKAS